MNPLLIDEMGWRMAEVYGSITDRILVNLASYFPYIHLDREVKDAFAWQAKMLAEMGKVKKESIAIIAASLKGEDEALQNALTTAIFDALAKEEPALQEAARKGYLAAPSTRPKLSPNQMQAFKLYYQQSADKLNLVNTVMLESTEAAYTSAVSDAVGKISRTQGIVNAAAGETITGVSAWNTAMHDAVAKMVANGLTGLIDHAGHHWSPEAYVAMDIRTTMFNTARAAVWERNQDFGNDIYQVSTKSPARPLCYPWQGKLLSTTGYVREVPDLDGNLIPVHSEDEVESFRWGGGLFGVNCGHYPMPFIPGLSVIRGEPMDQEENDKLYELTQQQRQMERDLRKDKLDLAVMKSQGASDDAILAQRQKVSKQEDRLNDFCKANELPRRKNREYTPVNATFPE